MAFNRIRFEELFLASLEMLAGAEGVTKRELRDLSRTVLEATHETGDISYVNKVMGVLTPVNKRVAREFFVHFTGFHFDDKEMVFTKKSGKHYLDCKTAAMEFLADPNQNIWAWAERHIDVTVKPFDLKKVTKFVESALKKADKEGFSKADVLMAVVGAGFEIGDLISVLEKMGAEVKAEGVLSTTTADIPKA